MKRLRAWVIGAIGLLLLSGSPGVYAEDMEPLTIRVLSFNILHGATTEGTFDLERIAQVIRDTKPDLVALQEVDFKTRRARNYDLATELGQRLGMASIFAKAMDHDGGEYGEAILSRYTFESTRRIALPYSEGKEPRAAVEVVVSLPNDQQIAFVGTHLDHTSDSEREMQATALLDTFKDSPIPVLLAGDFNATPESQTIKLLQKTWTTADGDNPPPTFPSDDPKIKIDYVMFAPTSRWTVVETKVIQDIVASDHCAYLAVLQLRPE